MPAGSNTISDRGCAALVGTDVGRFARITVAEIGDRLSDSHAGTAGRQLEMARPGRRIQTGPVGVDRLAAHTVRLLTRRDLAVEEVVVAIVVDVPLIVTDAAVLRRAHVEDVVSGNGVLDDASSSQCARREP